MDVSIIIVNYNTKQLLLDCLASIYKQTKDIQFEVIVSDNGSIDGSIEAIKEMFPQVIIIENKANLGFGAANNRGLAIAKGEYIFYLNSDTVLLNNAVKIFYDYWNSASDKENIGALGCNLQTDDGCYSISYADFPSPKKEYKYLWKCILSSLYIKKIYYFFNITEKDFYKVGDVDFLIGADLFIKNNEYANFDEQYFMYYEESDLQLKMKLNNLSRQLITGPKIIHYEGGSLKSNKLVYDFKRITSKYYWDSCLKYLRKNCNNEQKYIKKIDRLLKLIYLVRGAKTI